MEARLNEALIAQLRDGLAEMEEDARAEMAEQQVAPEMIRPLPKAHLRYEGTDSAMVVEFGSAADLAPSVSPRPTASATASSWPDKALIVEAISLELVGQTERIEDPRLPAGDRGAPPPAKAKVSLYANGSWQDAPVYDRDALQPGDRIDGPAIVIESTSTTIVDPGWQGP